MAKYAKIKTAIIKNQLGLAAAPKYFYRNIFMYNRLIQSSFLLMLIVLLGCKKENGKVANQNPLIIEDGPLSATLGKGISYTGSLGYAWGKNSDELFTEADGKLLRIDLLNATAEVIVNSQVSVLGRNHDNSALILAGKINNALGYYEYVFSSKKIEKILSIEQDQGTIFNKSGTDIFFYTSKISPPVQCDGYCWGDYYPGVDDPNTKFFYIDFVTKERVSLPGKTFICFAKDGTKALLNSQFQGLFFIFDHHSKKIVDSFSFSSSYLGANTVYFDNEPTIITADISGEMFVRKLRTGEEIQKIPATYKHEPKHFSWSGDGTKIYYLTTYLGIYDLATKEEKVINFPSPQGSYLEDAKLSPDNKRILVKYVNDYYFRDVN